MHDFVVVVHLECPGVLAGSHAASDVLLEHQLPRISEGLTLQRFFIQVIPWKYLHLVLVLGIWILRLKDEHFVEVQDTAARQLYVYVASCHATTVCSIPALIRMFVGLAAGLPTTESTFFWARLLTDTQDRSRVVAVHAGKTSHGRTAVRPEDLNSLDGFHCAEVKLKPRVLLAVCCIPGAAAASLRLAICAEAREKVPKERIHGRLPGE
mmetsp:Transcript_24745/g.58763  ORF Transcript_24745/g.58763 Transcript_24745/m.58763 type:complete len:210 (-) Transcript_24745:386-1015(-)